MFSSLLASLGIGKALPTITPEDLARHNTERSCLILAGTTVYDVTRYLDEHPGGRETLLRRGGGKEDCTRDLGFHSSKARRQWKEHIVAELGSKTTLVTALDAPVAQPAASSSSIGSISVEEAHAVPCARRGKGCECNCHAAGSVTSSGTQTRCCREGTGLPCCREDPAAREQCIWNTSGAGAVVRPRGDSLFAVKQATSPPPQLHATEEAKAE